MRNNIRSTNLRFNLDKDLQRKAWQYLQTMDKDTFKSYSNVIALSVCDYFERYYHRKVLSSELDAPAPCRLNAPDLDFACRTSADCLHQHQQVI